MEPSLNYAKKIHFPIRSRDLEHNSNEDKNFQIMIKAFLDLAIMTGNLKVLRNLYSIIAEKKTSFDHVLNPALDAIV